jgi:hypothetical protein
MTLWRSYWRRRKLQQRRKAARARPAGKATWERRSQIGMEFDLAGGGMALIDRMVSRRSGSPLGMLPKTAEIWNTHGKWMNEVAVFGRLLPESWPHALDKYMFCCVHPELTMETRMGSRTNSTTCYQDASNWTNLRPFDSTHEPNNNERGCNAASSSQQERNSCHEHFTNITTATIAREVTHAVKRSHSRSQVLLCL